MNFGSFTFKFDIAGWLLVSHHNIKTGHEAHLSLTPDQADRLGKWIVGNCMVQQAERED